VVDDRDGAADGPGAARVRRHGRGTHWARRRDGRLVLGQTAGWLLDHGFSYTPILVIAGSLHVLGFITICLTVPRIVRFRFRQPLKLEMKSPRSARASCSGRARPSAAAAFLHQPDGPARAVALTGDDGGLHVSRWLIVEISRTTASSASATPRSPRSSRSSSSICNSSRCSSARIRGTRVVVAAHVSKDDGVWRKGIAMVAISAVDIAIWDLLGKSAKQPAYRLMGGRTKPRIPVYASRLYSTPLDELASESAKYKREGYKAMKLRFGWAQSTAPKGCNATSRSCARCARPSAMASTSWPTPTWVGRATTRCGCCVARTVQPALARGAGDSRRHPRLCGIARRGRIPISGGEHEHTLHGFRELIAAEAVDVIQFDTNRVGGLTAARKIAALAEAHQIPVIPHAGQMHNYTS